MIQQRQLQAHERNRAWGDDGKPVRKSYTAKKENNFYNDNIHNSMVTEEGKVQMNEAEFLQKYI